MEAYIHFKHYNSDFGDMVPCVLPIALHLNITILDTDAYDVTNYKLQQFYFNSLHMDM